jgi:hypothetical protein
MADFTATAPTQAARAQGKKSALAYTWRPTDTTGKPP